MSKASEAALGDLHAAVAVALKNAIDATGDDGKPIVASAAHLAAAITFLKNNSITADPATNGALDDLKKTLADKRQNAKGKLKANLAAADDLAQMLPGLVPGSLQ